MQQNCGRQHHAPAVEGQAIYVERGADSAAENTVARRRKEAVYHRLMTVRRAVTPVARRCRRPFEPFAIGAAAPKTPLVNGGRHRYHR
jgi:hypothetical protein